MRRPTRRRQTTRRDTPRHRRCRPRTRLRRSAPHIHIEILPLSSDIGRQLESGEADLALGFMPQLEAGFYQTVLFEQTFVCLVSAHHPRVRKSLSLAQFQREDHAVISSSGAAPLLIFAFGWWLDPMIAGVLLAAAVAALFVPVVQAAGWEKLWTFEHGAGTSVAGQTYRPWVNS